ncbi:MAG: hypothetical protein H0U76_18525 [Ktedonobacteraceae bacterium]|nr:hypothetical protein [Ktedonobacteraceae bacterium]
MIPAYKEDVRVVPMGADLGPAYQGFEHGITQRLAQIEAQGDRSAQLPWFQALLVYPDMPWVGWKCKTRRGTVLGEAPALPKQLVYPLEQALIDYVREQFERRLPVIVFTENTGIYDDQERLKNLFERYLCSPSGDALDVAILRATVHGGDRQAWINERIVEGVDVLICNPVLTCDLTLTYFKRIAYKRIPQQSETLYRSARCLLRPEQDENIETVFFSYQGSVALRLLHQLAFPGLRQLDTAVFKPQGVRPLPDIIEEIARLMREDLGHERTELAQH